MRQVRKTCNPVRKALYLIYVYLILIRKRSRDFMEHGIIQQDPSAILNNYFTSMSFFSKILIVLFAIALIQVIRKRIRMRKDMKILKQIDNNRQVMYNNKQVRKQPSPAVQNMRQYGNNNFNDNKKVVVSDRIIDNRKKGGKK